MFDLQRHRDGIIGFLSGAVFGIVSLIVGHPFDTLKTSMSFTLVLSVHSNLTINKTHQQIESTEKCNKYVIFIVEMQAQMTYSRGSQFHVLFNVLRREGVIGLYRGCIPPLISSPILRSVQFGAYAEG
jgi:solute carrier family 25 carnitine/acylcarnitine transporter 20/29